MFVIANEGYCPVCEERTHFEAANEWLRDFYLCRGCGTIPRQRALMEVLNHVAPGWREGTLHESSPTIPFLARRCPHYSYSFYFEKITPGTRGLEGSRCENLEKLTFPDASFDTFVTQDVLEHVFQPDRALQQIMRVLKPGGVHVFTTPRHRIPESRPRAVRGPEGSIEYLAEAVYHGNPIDPKGALVTWDYGMDFDQLAAKWSGYLTSCYVIRDRARGIDGEFLDVWATRKDPLNAVVP